MELVDNLYSICNGRTSINSQMKCRELPGKIILIRLRNNNLILPEQWSGVIIVALQWLIRFVIPVVVPNGMAIGVIN